MMSYFFCSASQPLFEISAHARGVVDEAFVLHHRQRGEAAGAGEIVAAEGGRVDDAAVHARKGLLVNRAARDDGRRGHVTAAERLGQREDVGLEAPVLEGEPFAGAAEAGLHLVADEERAVLAAERLRAVVVIVLRRT